MTRGLTTVGMGYVRAMDDSSDETQGIQEITSTSESGQTTCATARVAATSTMETCTRGSGKEARERARALASYRTERDS